MSDSPGEKYGRHHVDDFLAFEDAAFVQAAYQAILQRAPDDDGLNHYVERLRAGAAKIEILGALRYSAEGRDRSVQIEGLRLPYLARNLFRLPLLGRLAHIAAALWGIPELERDRRAFENAVARLAEDAGARYREDLAALRGALAALEKSHQELRAFAATRPGPEALQELHASVARLMAALDALRDAKAEGAALEALRTEAETATQALQRQLMQLSQTVAGKAEQASLETEQA